MLNAVISQENSEGQINLKRADGSGCLKCDAAFCIA